MAYGQSKTANILFALALDDRAKAYGVRAFSLHPGSIVGTGLSKDVSVHALRAMGLVDEDGNPIIDPARNMKTVAQGAATSVWCATSPQLNGMGGLYCHNCDIAPLVTEPLASNQIGSMAQGVMPHAVDPDAADRLWTLSEQLLGLKPFRRNERPAPVLASPYQGEADVRHRTAGEGPNSWFSYNAIRVMLGSVIRSFRDRDTRAIFNREWVQQFESIAKVAHRKLREIHWAARLSDLAALPGNRLEALKGTRTGQYSIRINDQYRVCFAWDEKDAYGVEIVGCH